MMKLPKVIYVSVREPGAGAWLNAEPVAVDVIEDNGPTKVGTYRLIEVQEMRKEAVSRGRKRQ